MEETGSQTGRARTVFGLLFLATWTVTFYLWPAINVLCIALGLCAFCVRYTFWRPCRRRIMVPVTLASVLLLYAAFAGPAVFVARSYEKTAPIMGAIYAPINYVGRSVLGFTPPWQAYRRYIDWWKDLSRP
jgi:uncharacterized membrane protein